MKITYSQHLMRIQAEFTAAECTIWMKMLIYPWKMEIYMIEENSTQKCDKHLHENESLEKLKTSNNTREDSTHGHHQMANTKIRLIIFFEANNGEAVCCCC